MHRLKSVENRLSTFYLCSIYFFYNTDMLST